MRLLFLLLFIQLQLPAQVKMKVEEVALYHLNYLVKNNSLYKNVNYTFNGYLQNPWATLRDTLIFNSYSDFHAAPRKLLLSGDTGYSEISVPQNLKGNGTVSLEVHPYLKHKQVYYILFQLHTSRNTLAIVLVMNEKGALLRHKISYLSDE